MTLVITSFILITAESEETEKKNIITLDKKGIINLFENKTVCLQIPGRSSKLKYKKMCDFSVTISPYSDKFLGLIKCQSPTFLIK